MILDTLDYMVTLLLIIILHEPKCIDLFIVLSYYVVLLDRFIR